METTEIRIGNYFMYGAKEVFISEILKAGNVGIYDGFGLDEGHPLDMLKPIPLTEDTLYRFGFRKKEHDESRRREFIERDHFPIYDHKDINMYVDCKKCFFYVGMHFNHIKLEYVHQLQNLYFAITGDSLIFPPIV
jgi:hypothetical protein